jgi:hypothetical protein
MPARARLAKPCGFVLRTLAAEARVAGGDGAPQSGSPAAVAGMEFVMKAWIAKLASFAPPMWLTTAVAALAAAALLSAFIDTLHEHLRHGDEMRQAQRAAARHPAFAQVVADAATADAAQIKRR